MNVEWRPGEREATRQPQHAAIQQREDHAPQPIGMAVYQREQAHQRIGNAHQRCGEPADDADGDVRQQQPVRARAEEAEREIQRRRQAETDDDTEVDQRGGQIARGEWAGLRMEPGIDERCAEDDRVMGNRQHDQRAAHDQQRRAPEPEAGDQQRDADEIDGIVPARETGRA